MTDGVGRRRRPVVDRDDDALIHQRGVLVGFDSDLGDSTVYRIEKILNLIESGEKQRSC